MQIYFKKRTNQKNKKYYENINRNTKKFEFPKFLQRRGVEILFTGNNVKKMNIIS